MEAGIDMAAGACILTAPFTKTSSMANTKSALKRVRQTERRTERNRAAKSRLKTLRKKVATATESGKAEEISSALNEFASAVDRAAKSSLIHKNAASRLKSKAAAAAKKTKA